MSSNPKNLDEVLKILQYFHRASGGSVAVTKELLWDTKTGLSLPLLTYALQKLLPIGILDKRSVSAQHMQKETCTFIATGSTAEGLYVEFFSDSDPNNVLVSDIDMFLVPKIDTLPAINVYDAGGKENLEDVDHTDLYIKLVKHRYPGFVIIMLKDTGKPMPKWTEDIPDLDVYLEKYVENAIVSPQYKNTKSDVVITVPDHEENKEVSFVYKVKSKVSAATSHSDIVYAYPSASWPTSAQTWITRTREAKWPNNVLMKQILSNGVHYVKKCPKEIQYTHLAPYFWRISFSLAERDLARHFNETQRQCTILLKLAKEDFPCSDVITSYHIKTVMFWACEDVPQHHWIPANLGQLFLQMLDRLYLAVIRQYLPQYFIPELNLLANIPRSVLITTARYIYHIRHQPHAFTKKLGSNLARLHQFNTRSDTEIVVINTNLITNIESAIPDEYSSLHMFVNIIVIMAKRGYELSGNAEVFAEVLRDVEEVIDILGGAFTCGSLYKQVLFNGILETSILSIFSESDIKPYYLYCGNSNNEQIERCACDKNILETFYKDLENKHTTDGLLDKIVFQNRMMMPFLTFFFGSILKLF